MMDYRRFLRDRIVSTEGPYRKATDEGSFRVAQRLAAENDDLIASKVKEFCDQMARLYGRRLASDKDLVASIGHSSMD